MKDAPRQQFRNAPHVSGVANVKPKDYEANAELEVEADSEYAAWAAMRTTEQPLHVGDLLEAAGGGLRICKYVGFEEARWILPEPTQQSLPAVTPEAAAAETAADAAPMAIPGSPRAQAPRARA